MKKNIGTVDRILRVALAGGAIAVALLAPVPTTAVYVLYGVAAIMGLTAVAGFCPLYAMFGIKTCSVASK
jgi:hypothetical protein